MMNDSMINKFKNTCHNNPNMHVNYNLSSNIQTLLPQLTTDALNSIAYWRKCKHRLCYLCRKRGHLAADCSRVCQICLNVHAPGVCVFAINSLLQRINYSLAKISKAEYQDHAKRCVLNDLLSAKISAAKSCISSLKNGPFLKAKPSTQEVLTIAPSPFKVRRFAVIMPTPNNALHYYNIKPNYFTTCNQLKLAQDAMRYSKNPRIKQRYQELVKIHDSFTAFKINKPTIRINVVAMDDTLYRRKTNRLAIKYPLAPVYTMRSNNVIPYKFSKYNPRITKLHLLVERLEGKKSKSALAVFNHNIKEYNRMKKNYHLIREDYDKLTKKATSLRDNIADVKDKIHKRAQAKMKKVSSKIDAAYRKLNSKVDQLKKEQEQFYHDKAIARALNVPLDLNLRSKLIVEMIMKKINHKEIIRRATDDAIQAYKQKDSNPECKTRWQDIFEKYTDIRTNEDDRKIFKVSVLRALECKKFARYLSERVMDMLTVYYKERALNIKRDEELKDRDDYY